MSDQQTSEPTARYFLATEETRIYVDGNVQGEAHPGYLQPFDTAVHLSIRDTANPEDALINGCGDCGSPWSEDRSGLDAMLAKANLHDRLVAMLDDFVQESDKVLGKPKCDGGACTDPHCNRNPWAERFRALLAEAKGVKT